MSNIVRCGDFWACGKCCKACYAQCVCEVFPEYDFYDPDHPLYDDEMAPEELSGWCGCELCDGWPQYDDSDWEEDDT